MATKDKKDDKEKSAGEVRINVGILSIRLPTDLEQDATPQTLSELKEAVVQDLLSIAATPTRLLSQIMQGLVRIVRVATFGGRKKRPEQQLSRVEALANLQAVLEKNDAVIVESKDGHPVILLGEQARKALPAKKAS